MDWYQARRCWVDAEGHEHATIAGQGPGLTYALVTWLDDKGAECQTEGILLEVNREQAIVQLNDHGACFIPRAAVKRIESLWKTTTAHDAEKDASWTATPATSSAKSAAVAGPHKGDIMRRALLSAILAVLVIASPRAAEDLVGRYRCDGTNAGGKPYMGVLDVREIEKGVWHFRWQLTGGESALGVTLREKDTLAVAYSTNGALGVAVYRVKGKTLTGRWNIPGLEGIYSETCTKDPNAELPPAPSHAVPDVRERV